MDDNGEEKERFILEMIRNLTELGREHSRVTSALLEMQRKSFRKVNRELLFIYLFIAFSTGVYLADDATKILKLFAESYKQLSEGWQIAIASGFGVPFISFILKILYDVIKSKFLTAQKSQNERCNPHNG